MPIIVAKIDTLNNMHANLRASLLRAGIPEYNFKERRAGFKVWHADRNEGESQIHWHTFTDGDELTAQRTGLEVCAARLHAHYWIRLDMPGLYTEVNRPTLRVVHRLTWLS